MNIRQRQNMEILDVYKNLNRQILGRELKQIAVFPQTILPRQQRDLEVEVNTDKTIEQLTKILETKLASLEFYAQNAFLPRFSREKQEPYGQAFQVITSTGDVIPLWNQIVRYYQTPGLNKDTVEMVKKKIQDLKPNLDALQYGLKGIINESFQSEKIGSIYTEGNPEGAKLLEIIRSLSVYTLLARQVDSADLILIDVSVLKSAYENILQTLSTNQILTLKNLSARSVGFLNTPLRGIPNVVTPSGRIQALQEELGVKIPEDKIARLRNLPIGRLSEQLSKISRRPSEVKDYKDLIRLIETRKALGKEINDNDAKLKRIEAEYSKLEKTPRVIPQRRPLPPRPMPLTTGDQPFTPPINATPQERADAQKAENTRATKEYKDKFTAWEKEKKLNDRLQAEADAKNQKREDDMKEKERVYMDEANLNYDRREDLKVVNDTILRLEKSDISVQMKELLDNIQPLNLHQKAQDIAEMRPLEGFGKRLETRGLATIRDNYGKDSESDESESESESDSDKDALHFDDSRNEHYYSRPLKV